MHPAIAAQISRIGAVALLVEDRPLYDHVSAKGKALASREEAAALLEIANGKFASCYDHYISRHRVWVRAIDEHTKLAGSKNPNKMKIEEAHARATESWTSLHQAKRDLMRGRALEEITRTLPLMVASVEASNFSHLEAFANFSERTMLWIKSYFGA